MLLGGGAGTRTGMEQKLKEFSRKTDLDRPGEGGFPGEALLGWTGLGTGTGLGMSLKILHPTSEWGGGGEGMKSHSISLSPFLSHTQAHVRDKYRYRSNTGGVRIWKLCVMVLLSTAVAPLDCCQVLNSNAAS